MKLRKLLSGVLAACMIVTMLPTVAFADEPASPAWSTDVVFANLHDNTGSIEDANLISSPHDADPNGTNPCTIKLSGKSLKKHHAGDQQNTEGYWIGVGVPYAKDYKYYSGWTDGSTKIPESLTNEITANKASQSGTGDEGYVTEYWDLASVNNEKNYGYIVVKSTGAVAALAAQSITSADATATYIIDFSGVSVDSEGAAASIGSNYYPTVSSAIALASGSGTIKLEKEVTESITIPSGKTITLNLNGKTLTGKDNKDTITVENGATLNVTGTGTVKAAGAYAALFNNGTTTISGGTFTGSTYYTIVNHGASMTISGGKVNSSNQNSSLIENGYYSYDSKSDSKQGYVADTNAANPKLTITGGEFTGGLNNIKNDDGGTLTISSGTFSGAAQHAIMNWNEATISGGTFTTTTKETIFNGHSDGGHDKGELKINGSTFAFTAPAEVIKTGDTTAAKTITVTGDGTKTGTFSKVIPVDYLASGYNYLVKSNSKYAYYTTFDAAKSAAGSGSVFAASKPEIIGFGFKPTKSEVESQISTLKSNLKITTTSTSTSDVIGTAADNSLYFGVLGTETSTSTYTAAAEAGSRNSTAGMTAINGASGISGNKVIVVPLTATSTPKLQGGKYTVALFPGTTASGTEYGDMEIDVYSVSYDVNATSLTSPATQYVMKGDSVTLPTPSARSGYTFTGWKTDTSTPQDAGTTYTPTANTAFTAQWAATTVVVEPDDPAPSVDSSITGSDKTALESSLKQSKSGSLLNDADVNKELTDIQKGISADTVLGTALKNEGYTSVDVVAYLDITAKSYSGTGSNKQLKLDIKPMYKYKATGPGKTDQDIKGSEKPIKSSIDTPVQISVGVPTGFLSSGATKAYVQHTDHNNKKHIYEGTVTRNTGATLVTFTNPDGFSEFIIYAENPAAVKMGERYYSTLQEAVDAISANAKAAEITLLQKPASGTTATVNKDVQITLIPGSGVTLTETEMKGLLKADSTRHVDFVMNDKSGVFTVATTQHYTVTVDKAPTTGKGIVSASPLTQVPQGATVTVTVKPDEGFVLDELVIIAAGTRVYPMVGASGTYTFKMPPANASISYSFKVAPVVKDEVCGHFTDLGENNLYHPYIHAAVQNKIMLGMSDAAFGYGMPLTRAMVAQILFAKDNPSKPNLPVTTKFSDVKSGDWFANAVTWAGNNHIVEGYVENGVSVFKPYQPISRQELVTMMYSYAKAMPVTGSLSAYPDWNTVAPWAQAQMLWAVQNGIVTGIPEKNALYLKPQNITPREQAAVIFTKYFGYVK